MDEELISKFEKAMGLDEKLGPHWKGEGRQVAGVRILKAAPYNSQSEAPESYWTELAQRAVSDAVAVCPQCDDGHLVQGLNKSKGQDFWGCSNYPDCKYAANAQPTSDEDDTAPPATPTITPPLDVPPTSAILVDLSEPSDDLITSYVKYADRFELPPIMHELTIMTAIAALTNGKITIKNGGQTIPLDFWSLLISGSGAGRNTLSGVLRDLLETCGMAELISTDGWGSGQSMQEFFAKHPAATFYIWEEMSAMMQKFAQKTFQGGLEWITNLYDNFGIPHAVRYRSGRSKNSKTPDIVFSGPPRTNFLALTSEVWFLSATNELHAKGGFTARWCPLIVREPGRLIATPKEADRRLIPPMAEKMKRIAACKGEMLVTEPLQKDYQKWYEDMKRRFAALPNRALAEPFANRLRVHFLKLWAIYELSSSASLILSKESFERAVEMAKRIEETILTLLKTGFSSEGAESCNLEALICNKGPAGLSQTDLCNTYRGCKFWEINSRVNILLGGGIVIRFKRKPSGRGRPGLFFVHRDHLEQACEGFPAG
jgi:hypothetical protein